MKRYSWIFAFASVSALAAQDLAFFERFAKPMPKPVVPYFDWGACPGEGCVYRQWKAKDAITVYDTCRLPRHRIAELSRGNKFVALTGVVITRKPGIIRLSADQSRLGLKKGDVILTYAYRGEGESAVWLGGRYFSDFDISFAVWPDGSGCGSNCAGTFDAPGLHDWWAKIKLPSGLIGWINADNANFAGGCALSRDSQTEP